MMTALLLLADAAALTPGFDLNVMLAQLVANSPLAGVLLYLLLRTTRRVEKLEDRVLTAFEGNTKAMTQLTAAVNGSIGANGALPVHSVAAAV